MALSPLLGTQNKKFAEWKMDNANEESPPLMADPHEFPPITGQDIINCSFSSWYTKYHRLSPRARIIKPLPEEFIEFLKSDGIVIPGGYFTASAQTYL